MFIGDEYESLIYSNYVTEENLYLVSSSNSRSVKKAPMYDLTFLNVGKQFPPTSQEERVKDSINNEKLFNGDILSVLPNIQAKILVHLRRTAFNGGTLYFNNPSVENYFQLLTESMADMLVANNISISTYNKDEKQEKFISDFKRYIDKVGLIENLGRNLSIFGEAITVTSKVYTGNYNIRVVEPYNWYPIINDYTKEVIAHVVVSPIMINGVKHIIAEVHTVGQYERLIYTYNDGKLTSLVERSTQRTGLDDFAVKVITNGSLFGRSNYDSIKDLVGQIIVDNTLLDFMCNVYVTPSFQGGRQALETNAKGGKEFVFPKYTVIDGNEPVRQIEVSINSEELRKNKKIRLATLGRLTGMENVFRDKESVGVLNNFSALRLAKESDVNTVNKLKKRIQPMLVDLLVSCGSLMGIKLDLENIAIDWDISVALDIREKAEIEQIRTGGKATSSILSSIERLDNVSIEQAEKELELINLDNKGES